MNIWQKKIINLLKMERGLDFNAYKPSMIERRINKRVIETKRKDFQQYLEYLKEHPKELDVLINVMTINVSRFFRNTLTFEYFEDFILPSIVFEKIKRSEFSLRVWSAGCSKGEEPYSISILLNELIEKENLNVDLKIFATDINRLALKNAQRGIYRLESLLGIKYGFLKKFFVQDNEYFSLIPEIKNMVDFSFYDLMDQKTYTTPESIFGDFDIIACRNVLIYFDQSTQERIFSKLNRSLKPGGFLILGSVETIPTKFESQYKKTNTCCKIFQKRI